MPAPVAAGLGSTGGGLRDEQSLKETVRIERLTPLRPAQHFLIASVARQVALVAVPDGVDEGSLVGQEETIDCALDVVVQIKLARPAPHLRRCPVPIGLVDRRPRAGRAPERRHVRPGKARLQTDQAAIINGPNSVGF